MRIVIGVLLLAHGIAHVVGFLGAWGPTTTTLLAGRIDLGRRMKWVGLLWILLAVALVVAGVAAFDNTGWWTTLAIVMTGASLALCLLHEPEHKVGIVLNVVLLGLLVGGRHAGWY